MGLEKSDEQHGGMARLSFVTRADDTSCGVPTAPALKSELFTETQLGEKWGGGKGTLLRIPQYLFSSS